MDKAHLKTLVIAGTRDMIKEKHTRLIAANISDSELIIIEGNHFIASRNADELNENARKFLAR